MTTSTNSSIACAPRWATPRTDRPTRGAELAQIATELGVPFMPWQRLVADVGCEYDPETGIPAYRTVIVTVMRQSGKTTLELTWQFHRGILWPTQPQRIAYTAQTAQEARKKLVEEQYDSQIALSPLDRLVRQVKRGMADTAVIFETGSRIDVVSTSETAGHGPSRHLAVIDEAWADEDDRREAAFRPSMLTFPDAQMLIFSTAGTERSNYLRRKIEAGRQAAEEGRTDGIAYFEWSVPDDADIDDPDVMRRYHPALGRTISWKVLCADRLAMSDSEYRRANANQWRASQDRAIPVDMWEAATSERVAPDPQVFAIDAHPDRLFASVVVADDRGRAELVSHEPGVLWITERIVELANRWDAPVVIGKRGPLAHLIERLEAAEVKVIPYTGFEYVSACGSFWDRLAAGRLQMRKHDAFDKAAAAARKRSVQGGDAWSWTRATDDDDVSPLVALTLATDAAVRPREDDVPAEADFFTLGGT